jgi:GMP reductase
VKIDSDGKLDFKDVLIRPAPGTLSSRRDVDVQRTFKFRHGANTWTGLPIIASNMDTTGTFKMGLALLRHGALTALSKYYDAADLETFFHTAGGENAFWSMGITPDDLDKLRAVKRKISISKICIEVANGYVPDLPKFVATVRKENSNALIMAGSVCTPEMTGILVDAGADIIRVGIGSGSVCITRKVTGVGYPQLSAIIECSEAAHQAEGFVCSDGGCTVPGDICKAFGGGSDFVMLGGMLAGHDECEGKMKYRKKGNKKVPVSMQFYGMASSVAQEKHFGRLASYRAVEGKVVDVPYRGSVEHTILEIVGGLRSMMTYIDAKTLAEIPAKIHFIRVGAQLNNVYGGQ